MVLSSHPKLQLWLSGTIGTESSFLPCLIIGQEVRSDYCTSVKNHKVFLCICWYKAAALILHWAQAIGPSRTNCPNLEQLIITVPWNPRHPKTLLSQLSTNLFLLFHFNRLIWVEDLGVEPCQSMQESKVLPDYVLPDDVKYFELVSCPLHDHEYACIACQLSSQSSDPWTRNFQSCCM